MSPWMRTWTGVSLELVKHLNRYCLSNKHFIWFSFFNLNISRCVGPQLPCTGVKNHGSWRSTHQGGLRENRFAMVKHKKFKKNEIPGHLRDKRCRLLGMAVVSLQVQMFNTERSTSQGKNWRWRRRKWWGEEIRAGVLLCSPDHPLWDTIIESLSVLFIKHC